MKNFFGKISNTLETASSKLKLLKEKQEILSDIKLTVYKEEIYINNIITMTELEIEEESAREKYGKYYEQASAKIESTFKEIGFQNDKPEQSSFDWKIITKPKSVPNVSLQSLTDIEYNEILSNRQYFLKAIKRRCATNEKFRKIFLKNS